jgi:mRNA-degrading endonuclease RelE of RelBE toxin-antitoxin system
MMYRIEFTRGALNELRTMRAYDQRRIVQGIKEQLSHLPLSPTRNRKRLRSIVADFDHGAVLWELRLGDDRAFYDVDEEQTLVVIRAIRKKAPHQTTGEVIHEEDNP